MHDAEKTREELLAEIAELRARLFEPEETVHAIRHGEVDALVVLESGGERIYTLGTDEALRLLADAGEQLSLSLDFEKTLENAARLAVPALADWCMIDLVEEGGDCCRRVVSLHADPARQPLMEELKSHPLPRDSDSRLMGVLRHGESLLFPDLSEVAVEAELRSVDHARIIRQLAPRSSLAVPLVARGRTLGVWTFLYAESGRRYREEDLRVAQELARRVALALDNARLYREVETANRAKDHFLATLSHELRTPLTPVLAVASRLTADPGLPKELRTGLDMIRRNVELEARLIDDLLDLTRVTRGKLELHGEPLDLRQVIRQALETCDESELAARQVVEDLAVGEHLVWGDPSRLTQVFWNLLRNALKFTPEGGTVTVRSRVEEGEEQAGASCLIVEIADSGIGIEPEALPHIFDAFDQGKSGTTRRFGGLGLGLAISQAIVELHGGQLTAASGGRDRGATFTIRLPLSDLAAGKECPGEAPLPGSPPTSTVERPLHILLVEDHADTAEAMAGLLRVLGHQVTETGTVAAALAAAERGGVDLVLSDLGLPDGHGHDLMRVLVSRHQLPGIALSGYGMEHDIAKSRDAGFGLHLTKPVSLDTLLAAIRQVAGGG
jgi:signal transduction histidine kinase